MIKPVQWKYQIYHSTQGEWPCLSECPAWKEKQDRRQKLLFLPPSSATMGKGDFLGNSMAHLAQCCARFQDPLLQSHKKIPCNYWEGQWWKPQSAATWGRLPPACLATSQVSLRACCPSLLAHWLRRLDLLVEQWRVVSGTAAPNPVCKRRLQNRADLEARQTGLLLRCSEFVTQRFVHLLPPTSPGGEDQRLAAHRLVLLLRALSMP